jgi:molybdopterin-synthase adenylyltransferase
VPFVTVMSAGSSYEVFARTGMARAGDSEVMSIQLPAKPKLRGYYHLASVGDDRLLFEGGGNSVVLNGSSVRDLVPLLLPYLDGTNLIEDIVESLPSVEPTVILEALELFAANQLLEDANLPPARLAPSIERYSHQTTFWLSVSNDRYRHQEALAEARVAVIGLESLGSSVAHVLATSGVGRIHIVGDGIVSPADQLIGGYARQDIGKMKASALQRRLLELNDDIQCDHFSTTISTPSEAAEILEDCDFAIVCSDTPSVRTLEAVNEASLAVNVPWIRGSLDYHRGVIGPIIIPRETACFTCMTLRIRGNASYSRDAMALERHLRHERDDEVEIGLLWPFAGVVAHHLGLEAIKKLTGYTYPSTIGAFIAVDFFTSTLSRHEILKLPRCPSCGTARSRPQMKIWDVES